MRGKKRQKSKLIAVINQMRDTKSNGYFKVLMVLLWNTIHDRERTTLRARVVRMSFHNTGHRSKSLPVVMLSVWNIRAKT